LHLASGAVVPPRGTQVIPTGERLVVEMPGGGGLGDPLKRDPQAVQRDVAMGYVSKESARDLYKVVLDAKGAVDATATRAARGA
jgi:N-methylhydantoinase B